MLVVAAPQTAPSWPADVLDFAARHQIECYLEPLLAATRQVYPTARSLRVSLELDPEIRDDRHIVFDVEVPQTDIADYVKAQHRWTDELFRLCPTPLVCRFGMVLTPVAA
jgi:hypothetical protein